MVYTITNTPTDPKDLAFDLRLIYARLVGEHLIEAAEARKDSNFYAWYKALEDVKTVTKHKFKNKDETVKEYDAKIEIIKKLSNQYPGAWSGSSKDSNEVAKIEKELRDLEEWLYEKLEEGKVFGSSDRIAGL